MRGLESKQKKSGVDGFIVFVLCLVCYQCGFDEGKKKAQRDHAMPAPAQIERPGK